MSDMKSVATPRFLHGLTYAVIDEFERYAGG